MNVDMSITLPTAAEPGLQQAWTMLSDGDAASALRVFDEALRKNEANAAAWLGMASCQQVSGRNDDALRSMLCAFLYAEDDQTIAACLRFLYQDGRLEKAPHILRKMLANPRPAAIRLIQVGQKGKQYGFPDKTFKSDLMMAAWRVNESDADIRRILLLVLADLHRFSDIIGILAGVADDALTDRDRDLLATAEASVRLETEGRRLAASIQEPDISLAQRAEYLRQKTVADRSLMNVAFVAGRRRSRYMDFPFYIHLETLTVCNASCSFCPYPTLERQGTRMPDDVIAKIFSDLQDVPRDLPFILAPFKVSDPFIEKRLFDIMDAAKERLPGASIALITNGSAMTDRHLERLTRCGNVSKLTISLNDHRPDVYRQLMGIPFERTIDRMKALHKRVEAGDYRFEVFVSRVGDGTEADIHFHEWASREFPAFQIGLSPRNDWIGQMDLETFAEEVPDIGCNRWFMMSITATGKVALCCMDGEEKYVVGDVTKQNVLEIYNSPGYRVMRETLNSRRQAASPCNTCTYV